MEHLLKMSDLSLADIEHIIDLADRLKADHKAGRPTLYLAGKAVALMFAKPSTRTRASLEVGVYQLGGLGTFLNAATEMQLSRGEPIEDTARTLGRYYDGILMRTYKQSDLEAMAKWSGVPVINGLTDYAHPLQVLADLQTVRAYKGRLDGLTMCFVGDGNNMANSLIVGCLTVGMTVRMVCPPGYRPSVAVLNRAQGYGERFALLTDPREGVDGADVVFTDSWVGMGQEAQRESRRRAFAGYQINRELLALAKPDCMVQHCLPARKGEEISRDVFEAHANEIFDEAENRLHIEKSVLSILLGGQ